MKTVVILSITSDIGRKLAARYLEAGWRVIGTYRTKQHLQKFMHPNAILFRCDVSKKASIVSFLAQMLARKYRWEMCISCIGDVRPLTSFFQTDFPVWNQSVQVNSVAQLQLVHGLYPLRQRGATVCFFAGGGVNNPVVNFSAYTIGKIMLIKMCEYLHAEEPDMNIFIVGPGWTKTKIHQTVISDPSVSREKYDQTVQLLETTEGTSMEDIFHCIEWLRKQGRAVAGGRNFSVVHDIWKGNDAEKLASALRSDPNMYKLRRYKNDWKPSVSFPRKRESL